MKQHSCSMNIIGVEIISSARYHSRVYENSV